MSDIEMLRNFGNATAQEAHFARARRPTAALDSHESLNTLLFLSHHRLHSVAKRDKCHKETHFCDPDLMFQEKVKSAIDDGMTQDTPNCESTTCQTDEVKEQCKRR